MRKLSAVLHNAGGGLTVSPFCVLCLGWGLGIPGYPVPGTGYRSTEYPVRVPGVYGTGTVYRVPGTRYRIALPVLYTSTVVLL